MLGKPRLVIAVSLALAITTACFVQTRRIASPAATRQIRPSLTATEEQLAQRVHAISDPIHSFVMRTNLSPSVLEPSEGLEKDYATVGAYILFRKPDDIRILGQYPVTGSTLFDMVSNGKEFRVSIPRNKWFIIGRSDSPETSKNKLENLRPDAILNSLVILPPEPGTDISFLEDDTEQTAYILFIVRRNQDQFKLVRNIYFDGQSLEITRQKTFDASGMVMSDTRYSDWKSYDGASFPSEIDIRRPKDNYEVQLSLLSVKVNPPSVTDDKFVLEPPPDTQSQVLK